VNIIVSRPPGDKQGPDIVDPLLTSDPAGVARATSAIDHHSTNRSLERGNCVLMPYMPTGALINVTEDTGRYRGKLTAFSIIIDLDESGRDFTATAAVSIEKEMS
jgi:hypothetical protein